MRSFSGLTLNIRIINNWNSLKQLILALVVISTTGIVKAFSAKNPVDYVNPKIVTAIHTKRWMLFPGATTPFDMVALSPDNLDRTGWYKGGFDPHIDNIMGFSHIHAWNIAGLLTMPTVGELKVMPGPADDPDSGYRSRFSNDVASPGYYAVSLDDYKVRAEFTSTTRTGFHRYTFPETEQARVLFDLKFPSEYNFDVVSAHIKKISDTEIIGYSRMVERKYTGPWKQDCDPFSRGKREQNIIQTWPGFTLCSPINVQSQEWQAKRIGGWDSQSQSNSWYNFVRVFDLYEVPEKANARIACDSKYWLWVNGEMVVFEGQLKRGPTPNDTYFDEVDIAPWLKTGDNTIAVLLWHFGKDGFSHKNSGQAGLVFDCAAIGLFSDSRWRVRLDEGFEHTHSPYPNFRLPESNIRFDARKSGFEWTQPGATLQGFRPSVILGEAESPPWNKLVKRPIPMWKDFGVREYENNSAIPSVSSGEWIVCSLPYNCHVTPIFDIEAPAGLTINMQTDNFDYLGLEVASVRAEYVTRDGRQQYESPGWMNGHVVKYYIPEGVKINSLTYRETGYGCEFSGYFKCSDPFYEKLWEKALRTLYVNMRDTYMDCPDRERAQWWGDVVNQMGQAFYVLSPEAAALTQKGMLELINWQRANGTLYSPVPEGNWKRELPGQMLASIGYYGFWTYYMNSGDKETIKRVYNGVKRYLNVWKLKPEGILVERYGGWYWGDWGREIDRQLLYNAWYYLALKGYLNMSDLLGEQEEARQTQEKMDAFKSAFNAVFWDGTGYRTSDYEGRYDDRAQALAVVSGLADEDKYENSA
jgi:alpha-L-rhamnosidase